jgi:hypothetical protein
VKLIKMLGLATTAAIAAMALLGATNASAGGLPELCKEANKTPCPEGQLYTFSQESPLQIESKLKTGTSAFLKGTVEVKCTTSTINGKAEAPQTTEHEPFIEQIKGQITEVTWAKCTTFGGLVNCTATALQLPWKVHLNQTADQEQDNGIMYVGEKEGQPGAKVTCLGVTREFKVEQEQPSEQGEWAELEVIGGNPAIIKANQIPLKEVGGGAAAGSWSAEYEVTSPNPVYVTHQE